MWALLPESPARPGVDVSVCGRNPGRKPGIRIHRLRRLDPIEVHYSGRLPITTPARTLLDLAAAGRFREVDRAYAEIEARKLAKRRDIVSVVDRHRGAPGTALLRRLLERDEPPAFTRSEAERRFLALIRTAELPPPEVNVRVGDHEVDFVWRSARLIVEVDGFTYHSSSAAFERDRLRDADLAGLGYGVLRVTWRQLVHRPEAMLVRIGRALAAGRG